MLYNELEYVNYKSKKCSTEQLRVRVSALPTTLGAFTTLASIIKVDERSTTNI